MARPIRRRMGGRTPWYLSGNIPKANCVAAYKPKGAASLAASYINLVNPGTYDCTVPSAAPTLYASGWNFNGSTQYLSTGITPANGAVRTWTLICRFADATSDGLVYGMAIGSNNGATQAFCITPRHPGADFHTYCNGAWGADWQLTDGRQTSGNMALAGGVTYLNGVADGAGFAPASINGSVIYIGGTALDAYLGSIQACAVYDIILVAGRILSLYNAMAAL